MSINKSISYILYNKSIIVNLYKLHFSSFHFSLQQNKRVFQPSHFSTPPTKHTRGKTKYFLSSHKSLLNSSLLTTFLWVECKNVCPVADHVEWLQNLLPTKSFAHKSLLNSSLLTTFLWAECSFYICLGAFMS